MSEIEIEKKFHPSEEQLVRLLEGAESKGEKISKDTYYDTAEYALTTKDRWLRKRNDNFELKISLNPDGNRTEDQYREVTDMLEIRRELSLSEEGEFESLLIERGIEPFGSWTTYRQKYVKDGFAIDVDDVDFGTFRHSVVEIELIVSDTSMIPEAGARILAFAKKHGLSMERAPGKATVYLQRERPEHLAALRKAQVIIE